MRARRVPLAWRNLTVDKQRLVLSTAGIAFAVLLMLIQLGFRGALLDSQVAVLKLLNCDLALLSSTKYRLLTKDSFPRRRVFQALAHAGVTAAYMLYLEPESALWKNPLTRTSHFIRVLGFSPDEPVFLDPRIERHRRALKIPDTVLLDDKSRSFIGPALPGVSSELKGRKVHVVGSFSLGTDFTLDGNIITSDQTFAALFEDLAPGGHRLDQVEIGLLKLVPGQELSDVQAALRATLPGDVKVMTKQELITMEWNFWIASTPVGVVFNLGLVIGFVVGVVICYQILFTDISEHLPKFATLKAMGHADRRLISVVLRQAFYLSLFGYVPAAVLGILLFRLISAVSGLAMRPTLPILGLVFILTVLMCMLSGLMASRKAVTTDPAEVF